MTRVLSLRLPAVLERTIRCNSVQCKMAVPEIVRLILEHSLEGQYSFSNLPDVPQPWDTKLDVRLPDMLVSNLRTEAERLSISVSVYSRVILYAYFSRKLMFIEIGGGRYTLAENHEQTKSA
jgi:hypothetical protein